MNNMLYIIVWLQIAWQLFLVKYEDCICELAKAVLIGFVAVATISILSFIRV